MNYSNVIREFAERTRLNLDYIEQALDQGVEVYETTQLVNSLLGLLVFPQQRFIDDIPETPLAELREAGWPDIQVSGDLSRHKNLNELMRYLRNAIAHFNIQFIADSSNNLHSMKIWNSFKGRKTWETVLTFDEIRIIVYKFTNLIMEME